MQPNTAHCKHFFRINKSYYFIGDKVRNKEGREQQTFKLQNSSIIGVTELLTVPDISMYKTLQFFDYEKKTQGAVSFSYVNEFL